MRIDLHAHSTASDGTEPPAEVVRRAAAAGLDVVALTDHDTTAGWPAAAAALAGHGGRIALVPGAEISAAVTGAATGRRIGVHLLGYLFDPAEPALAGELALLRDDRRRRAARMVELLAGLGAPVTYDDVAALAAGAPVGRPHVARALVAAGVVPDLAAAFGPEWIGTGGRAWVAKRAVEAATAVELVRRAGGVTVLAHPAAGRCGPVLADDDVAALAAAGLTGIEVDHPDHDRAARDRLRALAGGLGLVVTGASDDHGAATGHRLGAELTAPEAYEALVEAAGHPPLAA
ncbi:MAG: PHP domain-containing protein [Frankiaceae bacterium]